VLFAVINGIVILDKKYAYAEKAHLFIPILLAGIVTLLLIQKQLFVVPDALSVWLLVGLITTYLVLSTFSHRTLKVEDTYGLETIPVPNRSIAQVEPKGGIVKLVEIFFQDVVAFTIVATLVIHTDGGILAITIFTLIVLAIHVPAIKYFGKVYGTYFLVMSTILAPLAFYLLQFDQGLYYLFAFHASMYIVLYGGVYILSKIIKV